MNCHPDDKLTTSYFFVVTCLAMMVFSTATFAADLNEDLLKAAEKGDSAAVASLLQAGANINTVDGDRRTPLIRAAKEGNTQTARMLVEAGADLNLADRDRRTPLYRAAEEGHGGIVRLLAEAGADPARTDREGRTALFRALDKKRFDTAALLLRVNSDLGGIGPWVDSSNRDGETALIRAAREGAVEVVEALIRLGARLDLRDKKGRTASYHAREKKKNEVSRILADAEDASRALTEAVRQDDTAMVSRLLSNGVMFSELARTSQNESLLAIAINRRNVDMLRVLIDEGKPTAIGPARVKEAVGAGRPVVELLLQSGERVGNLAPAFRAAIDGQFSDVLEALLQYVDASRPAPRLLLRAAGSGGHDIARVLLNGGADVNHQATTNLLQIEEFSNGFTVDFELDPRGMTPLRSAIGKGDVEMVRLLLEAGADPDVIVVAIEATDVVIEDPAGRDFSTGPGRIFGKDQITRWSATQEFRREGTKVTVLGMGGAPDPLKDVMEAQQPVAPLITAITSEAIPPAARLAIVHLLLDHGASANVTDQKGLTPLMIAE